MVTEEVDRIAHIGDPFEQLKAATRRMAIAQSEVTELARLRRRVIQDLHAQGLSYSQIAAEAGLTRGRIHQLRHGGPGPEGAFLGQGRVIITTPLKQEAVRARPVVAVEDVTAAYRLGDLARTLGLDPEFEHVPVGGAIDLNRPNLIIICGPRPSDTVASVLAQDPVLEFVRAADGPWTLHDRRTNEVYRSGQDSSPPRPWDAAYLGRLMRPDSQGSLIVFTGIHPAGTLGVVQLIVDQIADLYQEIGPSRFSLLVGTQYDPQTGEPLQVERLTPIYRHEDGQT